VDVIKTLAFTGVTHRRMSKPSGPNLPVNPKVQPSIITPLAASQVPLQQTASASGPTSISASLESSSVHASSSSVYQYVNIPQSQV